MNSQIASERLRERSRPSARALTVLAFGPLTVAAGLVWAIVQPYRITLLHPHGQGFWWLFVEPPLWVCAVGLAFVLLIAPGLVEDLEKAKAADAAAR